MMLCSLKDPQISSKLSWVMAVIFFFDKSRLSNCMLNSWYKCGCSKLYSTLHNDQVISFKNILRGTMYNTVHLVNS